MKNMGGAWPWPPMAETFALAVFVLLLGIFMFYGLLNLFFSWKFQPTPRLRPNPNPGQVAILIPVKDDPSIFNSLPILERIDYPNYEVVIIDDSTKAAFRERLDRSVGNRTRILRREVRSGRKAGALNSALKDLDATPPRFVVVL